MCRACWRMVRWAGSGRAGKGRRVPTRRDATQTGSDKMHVRMGIMGRSLAAQRQEPPRRPSRPSSSASPRTSPLSRSRRLPRTLQTRTRASPPRTFLHSRRAATSCYEPLGSHATDLLAEAGNGPVLVDIMEDVVRALSRQLRACLSRMHRPTHRRHLHLCAPHPIRHPSRAAEHHRSRDVAPAHIADRAQRHLVALPLRPHTSRQEPALPGCPGRQACHGSTWPARTAQPIAPSMAPSGSQRAG